MQPGKKNKSGDDVREKATQMDSRVAQEIFGYKVFKKNDVLHEKTEKGSRPLRPYSQDMQWAWIVAEKMRVSILPVEGGQWFAFAGPREGWSGPETFLEYLQSGDFTQCGAAVHNNPAQAICEAALVVVQKQQGMISQDTNPEDADSPRSLH